MQIRQVGMTRNHFQSGNANRIRMVVMHSTAGRFPGDYNWLRNGGGQSRSTWVSIHYYIDKRGTISQMVQDRDIAWHAGQSTWIVDGQRINYSVGCNPVSIGIELENLNNGRDPYPPAQYAAALWLVRRLVDQYNIPQNQLVRHLDIAPSRKTDPAGFAWERFKGEVYQAREPLRPFPPSQQLRRRLLDLAYRAAGSAYPEGGWPLLKEAVSRDTGMPVAAISTPEAANPAESQNGQDRGMAIGRGQPFIIEAYGRDMFYAPTSQPAQVQRLSETEPPLRDGLMQVLFLTADPANGFKPEWAFHQSYLQRMTEIGVPIGPNHRLPGATSNGQTYVCQHFAVDSLCSPTGQWDTVIRLSDLTRDMYGADSRGTQEKELRTLLLNDLYRTRTGRDFDQDALFNRHAISNGLGAPLGKAEEATLNGERFVAMPFALDVIYARIPPDGDWRNVVVGELPTLGTFGAAAVADAPASNGLAGLGALLTQDALEEATFTTKATPNVADELTLVLASLEDIIDDLSPVLGGEPSAQSVLPDQVHTGGLLGPETATPPLTDLTLNAPDCPQRDETTPSLVVVYPTSGPASTDIFRTVQADKRTWHYYVSLTGEVLKLLDEACVANVASDSVWQGELDVDQRSIAVAVESGTGTLGEDQAAALTWLLQDLTQRYNLTRQQIMQEADLSLSRVGDWDTVLGQIEPASDE